MNPHAARTHRFVWHDLMTTDAAGAREFYTALFGWRLEDIPMGPFTYSMIHAGDGPIGGIVEEKAIPMSHWMPYVAVAKVDDSAKRCAELGGSVCVPPTDIPNVGRFAVCGDPQGAYFSIFTALEGPPGADPDAYVPGRVCWNELLTTDDEAAQKFYGALFGWTAQHKDLGPLGVYRIQHVGSAQAGGIMKNPMPGGPPWWSAYFAAEDLTQATERARKLGAKVLMADQPIEGIGKFSMLQDPTGAHFSLFQALSS